MLPRKLPDAPFQNGYGCLAVAIALLSGAASYLLSINEYVATFGDQMSGAYDCDGPVSVLIFLIPAVILAILGIVLSLRAWRRNPTWIVRVAVIVGFIVLVVELVRLPPTISQLRKNTGTHSPCV